MMPAYTLFRALTDLPHRGTATLQAGQAQKILEDYLLANGAEVRTEAFRTPKTYVSVVYWLIGGLLFGLAFPPTLWTAAFVWLYVYMAWLYFNWRASPVTAFPPLHKAYNLVGRWPAANPNAPLVILLAHVDTAPISLLYGPRQQSGFRTSLIISLILMAVAGLVVLVEALLGFVPWLTYARYALMAYFTVQAIIGTAGFWLKGYANGASDNATGVMAALQTAERLAQPSLTVEVVLTTAEEVGMIGAQQYVKNHLSSWNPNRTLAINFDTLGAGQLTVIEQTGTLEPIRYNSIATRIARQLLQTPAFAQRARIGRWHTADFDSVWFVRHKIPVLALCALDADGRMPRIHQADDRPEAVDFQPVADAVDLAEAVVQRWQAEIEPKN